MPDPIIIDCGGSTRIKQASGNPIGNDDLVNVQPGIGPPAAAGEPGSRTILTGRFTQIMIVFQDALGIPFQYGPNPLPAPVAPVGGPKAFEIFSGLNQRVIGRVITSGSGADLEITVCATGRVDPIVEAKQHKGRRRYLVSNAGGIEKITIAGSGTVLDVSVPTLPPGAISPTGAAPTGLPIYVSVIVS